MDTQRQEARRELEDRYEVRLAGEGGQGMILAGVIAAELWADIEAAKADLGYVPDVDFKAGLSETFKWFTRVFSESTPVGGIRIGE